MPSAAPRPSEPAAKAAPRHSEPAAKVAEPATLIDASALIALLGGEPAAEEVQALLRSGGAAMTALNLAEAVDWLQRRYGLDVAETRPVIEGLLHDSLALLPLDASIAWRAAELRAKHYHRTRCPLSLAHVVLLASVPADGHLASSDAHLLSVAASEGIGFIALPDSQGRRYRGGSIANAK